MKKNIIIALILIVVTGVVYYAVSFANKGGGGRSPSITLNNFEKLEIGTSYSLVEKQFGAPEENIGSGINIFVYTLSDGSRMLLGFADLKSLLYIKHRLNDGTVEDISPKSVPPRKNLTLTNEKMENLENFSDPKIIQGGLDAGKIVLIDVREKSEWDAGHIAGATHIALGDLNLETTKNLPKDIPIYLYCRSGARAGTAEAIMQGLGFSNAKNLGGIIDWQNNGGVLVK